MRSASGLNPVIHNCLDWNQQFNLWDRTFLHVLTSSDKYQHSNWVCDTQSSCRIGKEGKGYLISSFMLIVIYHWKNTKLVIMQEKSGFCRIWVFIYLIYLLYWSLGGAIRDCVRQTSVFHSCWLLLWLVHCGYLSVVTCLHCTWMRLGSLLIHIFRFRQFLCSPLRVVKTCFHLCRAWRSIFCCCLRPWMWLIESRNIME